MSLPDLPLSWQELADGLALYDEHKPQGGDDWVQIARRFREAGDELGDVSHLFAALYQCVDALSKIAESERPNDGYPMVEIALAALGESA